MNTALSEAALAFAKTAAQVRSDQLSDPTPCHDFTVGQLLAHVGGTLTDSERAARKAPRAQTAPAGGTTEPTNGSSVAEAAERTAAAWLEPSALDGTTDFGPGEMPAALAADITVHELALHGWDLASATGHDFVLSDATCEAVLGIVDRLADQARASGGYGPELIAAPNAGAFERALAASGRGASWHAGKEAR